VEIVDTRWTIKLSGKPLLSAKGEAVDREIDYTRHIITMRDDLSAVEAVAVLADAIDEARTIELMQRVEIAPSQPVHPLQSRFAKAFWNEARPRRYEDDAPLRAEATYWAGRDCEP
jgi:hypothetical protein